MSIAITFSMLMADKKKISAIFHFYCGLEVPMSVYFFDISKWNNINVFRHKNNFPTFCGPGCKHD